MIKRTIPGALIFLVLLFLLGRSQPSAGQTIDKEWSNPYRLSSQEGAAGQPYVLSDQFGRVHIFWVETSGGDGRSTIFYTNFDGTVWASPVDIYATAAGLGIPYMSTDVDQVGILHLVWSEGETGPVYHTSAPAYNALSARNWQSPFRLELASAKFELEVDDNGTFHLMYVRPSTAGSGLFYRRSEDKGNTWSEPRWLDPDTPSNLIANVIDFDLDENNDLHAVWTYIDLNVAVGAAGTGLRYIHSLDGGQSWSLPIDLDEADESPEELRMAFPAMTVDGDTVNIVWTGSESVRREYSFSTDRGQTWNTSKHIFGNLQGQARGDGLAVDSLGRTHFIGNIRWPTGLYHSTWDGVQWSPISLVYLIRLNSSDEPGDRISAHDIRLAVRAGNQLVVAFGDAPGEAQRGLFVMQHILADAPLLPVEAIPTATPTTTPLPTATTPAPTPSPTPLPFIENTPQSPAVNTSPGRTLVLGILPILGLLGVVVVLRAVILRR